MRQTLLRIPLDADWWLGFGTVPTFGFGLILILWILFGAAWAYRNRKQFQFGTLFLWLFVAFVIVKIPDWVQKGPRNVITTQSAIIEQKVKSPELAAHYLTRGEAHEAVYEYDKAASDYQTAIDLAPELDSGSMHLAWLYATCPKSEFRDGEKAQTLATTAIDHAKVVTAVHWDILGAAQAEAGLFAEAIQTTQKAAKNADASNNPSIKARLQDIRNHLELYEVGQSYVAPRFSQEFPQSLPIRGYGFLMFLGFIAGGTTATLLARRVGLTADVVWDLGIWSLIGGIAGARMFYLVQYHERVFAGKSGFELLLAPFELQEGGLVLLGGLLFGSGIFFAYCYYRNLKPLLMADIALPGFFVALAFGRLGCLMNGCCYGDRCELPWAIEFPLGSVPDMALVLRGFVAPESPWSLALHPTQIYSSLNALVLAFLTATYFRFRTRNGEVLAMGMLTYPITRFSIEYLRGDEMGQFGTGFTISQIVSLGIFAAGLVFAFWLSRRPRQIALPEVHSANVHAPGPKQTVSRLGA